MPLPGQPTNSPLDLEAGRRYLVLFRTQLATGERWVLKLIGTYRGWDKTGGILEFALEPSRVINVRRANFLQAEPTEAPLHPPERHHRLYERR